MIKHGQEKRPVLKDLIPCLHFSENCKNLEKLGGVKLKHLLEIQNIAIVRRGPCCWALTAGLEIEVFQTIINKVKPSTWVYL